jgi:hypothetical protein
VAFGRPIQEARNEELDREADGGRQSEDKPFFKKPKKKHRIYSLV